MLKVVLALMAEAGSAATVWRVPSLEQEDFGEHLLSELAEVGVELEAEFLEQILVARLTLTGSWFQKHL